MDVSVKKVGVRGGRDRFVLVNSETRKVVTANDVSEAAVRRFFRQLGADDQLIGECIERARERYGDAPEVDQERDTVGDGDLLLELGLDDDDEDDA